MNKTLSVLVAGTLLMVGAAPALAARQDISLMGGKLGRGVVNASTGWIELPKQIVMLNEEWGPAFGVVLGSLHGLEVAAVRTLAGVYEAITFPVPIPAGYAPVVMPASAFTWQGLSVLSPR